MNRYVWMLRYGPRNIWNSLCMFIGDCIWNYNAYLQSRRVRKLYLKAMQDILNNYTRTCHSQLELISGAIYDEPNSIENDYAALNKELIRITKLIEPIILVLQNTGKSVEEINSFLGCYGCGSRDYPGYIKLTPTKIETPIETLTYLIDHIETLTYLIDHMKKDNIDNDIIVNLQNAVKNLHETSNPVKNFINA